MIITQVRQVFRFCFCAVLSACMLYHWILSKEFWYSMQAWLYNVTCFSFIFQVYFKCLISWLDVKLFFHTFLDFWIRYALFWCSCWLLSQVSSCYSSSDKFGWFLFCWASKQQNYSLFGICHLEIFPENMDFISMWKHF